MRKYHPGCIKVYLLPEEIAVFVTVCKKIGLQLHSQFVDVEGFEEQERSLDILFDLLQTIEDARRGRNDKTERR